MAVRELSVGDEAVAEAACRLFGAQGELDITAFLARPEAVLLVAEEPDGVAGWVYGHELIHPDGVRTMLLYSLDVAEGHQRRGHGRALVDAFVGHARDRGCTEVWVLTEHDNAAAARTYQAAGGRPDPQTPSPVMFTWKLVDGGSS